jgi:hypothetical protein
MSVKVWTAAALLCGIVLTALWITAWRVRSRKLAARSGDAELIVPSALPLKIHLNRGDRLRVEGFTLHFRENKLSVYDSRGRLCVDFIRMEKGQARRWQELQIIFLEVEKDAFTIEAEIKPGASCFGGGFYRALRTGLRVEFPGKQTFTIIAWDPAKPEMTARVERRDEKEEVTFGEKGERRIFGVTCNLLRTPKGDLTLLLDGTD